METEKVYQEKTARTIQQKQDGSGTLQFVDNRPMNPVLQRVGEDEEDALQGKFEQPLQREEDDEAMQGKFEDLTTGELSSLISYGIQILASMMMLSMVFVMTSMATESANRVVEVIEHESVLDKNPEGIQEVKDGSISFQNVNFKYSEKKRKECLKRY